MNRWAAPDVVTVTPLRLKAGENTVATLDGCYRHSADVHLLALASLPDGSTVRLYATAGNVESLVAEATVSAATLPTALASGARQGLIVGARNVLARSFRVSIEVGAAISDGGRLNLAGWGQ